MKKFWTYITILFITGQSVAGCQAKARQEPLEDRADIQQTHPDLQRAIDLVTQRNWSQAISLLEKITKEYPGDGEAWYYLAYSHHSKKEYIKAIEYNQKAVEFSQKIRSSAYYNMACAYAITGNVDQAEAALSNALKEGFLDLGLLKTDPELAALRQKGSIQLPESQNYEQIKARNGIRIKYHVILPEEYDASKSYPALLAYPPGGMDEVAADWAIAEFWGENAKKKGWIIVVPVAPDRGWINHPAHHALNDLLKEVKSKHSIEGGKFHMLGFESGARPAATFALMSKQYFQSLTTISSYAWERWDNDDVASFNIMPVKMIVGERDTHGLQVASHIQRQFKKSDVTSDLTIIPDEARVLPSLRNAAVIDMIEDFIR